MWSVILFYTSFISRNLQFIQVFLKDKIDVAYAMYDYTAKFSGPEGLLRKEDVDELTQNYIVTKALKAFAQTGTIPRVNAV